MVTKISSEIVAHSLSPRGEELVSMVITFPRYILAEINTHRMLTKNTSSSRAVPFVKMLNNVLQDPFVPYHWQKTHTGMQGFEYYQKEEDISKLRTAWLKSRCSAVKKAIKLDKKGLTKQLCNRLLEPFTWTTMLITGNKEWFYHMFRLRCPNYGEDKIFSKEDYIQSLPNGFPISEINWLDVNKGLADIHLQILCESMYENIKNSEPTLLEEEEYHIPFEKIMYEKYRQHITNFDFKIKLATVLAARVSYSKLDVDINSVERIYNDLLTSEPKHSVPFEHCARVPNDLEYIENIKIVDGKKTKGFFGIFRGFEPFRNRVERGVGI